ncbi:MAG: hypothetical protein AB3N10_16920, partial [Allomuricauda sp.]
ESEEAIISAHLETAFNESLIAFSDVKPCFINLRLGTVPEWAYSENTSDTILLDQLTNIDENLHIKAPQQFGLTCSGKFLALEYWKKSKKLMLYIDAMDVSPHIQQLTSQLERYLERLRLSPQVLDGVIVDQFNSSNKAHKLLITNIFRIVQNCRVVLLERVQSGISDFSPEFGDPISMRSLYVWALSRNQIRSIVKDFSQEDSLLGTEELLENITRDMNVLNIHRTPYNCITLLKVTENGSEEFPANRSLMIKSFLSVLFAIYNPKHDYQSKPDIIDFENIMAYYCGWLIKERRFTFTKQSFTYKCSEFLENRMIDIDLDSMWDFLIEFKILEYLPFSKTFRFRLRYWLFYFGGIRMSHDPVFKGKVLESKNYADYPEILEFYAGIDRRRDDLLEILLKDIREMKSGFLSRTGLELDNDIYNKASWNPNASTLKLVNSEIKASTKESSIPDEVKDQIADSSYDPTRVYDQTVHSYLNDTLIQYISGMQAASKALRNSDYASPNLKKELMDEIIICWINIMNLLSIFAPILSKERQLGFEGVLFVLDPSFSKYNDEQRVHSLLFQIPRIVCEWHQDDIISQKMGPLFLDRLKNAKLNLSKIALLSLLIKSKPRNWDNSLRNLFTNWSKNSFFLGASLNFIRTDLRIGSNSERQSQELKQLLAFILRKHKTGAKSPSKKTLKEDVAFMDKKDSDDE